MKIRNMLLALVVAAFAFGASRASAQVLITVGSATADAGGTATFQVTLSGVAAGGTLANNAQLDIIFPTAVFDVASGSVCTLDPRLAALNHTESLPTSPNPGEGNKRLRLNVIDSLDPLGDVTDGILYTCVFPVKGDAPAGDVTLNGTRVNVGDTTGTVILASGETAAVDGTVTVAGVGEECPSPTPIAPPTSGVFIQVGDVTQAAPGATANFSVSLHGVAAGGTLANNAQLDIIFPTAAFDVTSGSVCTLDPRLAALNHTESLPTSPNPGEGNKRLRLNVIDSLDPLGDVTDGVLYTCAFPVKADAATAEVVLNGTRVNVGDTTGTVILASGESAAVDGIVVICAEGPGPATETPTATPTETAVPTVTDTVAPTATRTRTPIPPVATATPGAGGLIEDEDGCQMTARGTSSAWALLIPGIILLGLRRRNR